MSGSHERTPNHAGTVLRFYPQDVSVTEDSKTLLAKVEQCLVPQIVEDGPKDSEMSTVGPHGEIVKISKIKDLRDLFSPEFDMLHTFTATRLTANMWRNTLESLTQTFDDPKLKNAASYWDNNPHGTLTISPYGLQDEMNAYYQRLQVGCELKFGYFQSEKGQKIFTCQTPDVVAHEAGHYSLDRLRPEFMNSNQMQTHGLHEAFGDISALSFVFADDAMANALIITTHGNLHSSQNFAAKLAEQFGISLGMHGYLRNADADYKLSDVENEEHALSEVFTGAYYDALARAFKDATNQYPYYHPANLLQAVSEFARGLLLHTIVTVQKDEPEFSDIARHLIETVIPQHGKVAPARVAYLKSLNWREYFEKEFTRREINIPSNLLQHKPKEKMKKKSIIEMRSKERKEILKSVCGGLRKFKK
ncbi:hypothetical protein FDP41_012699 [Naegleria fowleri]|uniref:Peptidase M4 C-terminal domain-containing protein n=1 Tax=Naegleria fowleri TaxID=5763 RepID=A0A6A5C1N0_NAEFO|nr:uncharacterized protein FDP41_012699 [Naegleria fowleri]KAF0980911.1 hypothetical protein FDP41_012699 [Naegleria fowleri]CAG4716612.1 unnamed protein product [Naegleria fowleri]